MNQVVVTATVERASTQQVKILFDKSGHGDDIVDQWGDRLIEGMQATIACTARQAQDNALPTGLRTMPTVEQLSRYYYKIYSCGNCGWLNMVWFVKRTCSLGSVTCEKCECETAQERAEANG